MNIALFGGSFDPPHIGHKTIVIQALKNLNIDKLIVMPTFLNPFKSKSHFTAKQRLEMTKDMFKDIAKVEISNYETSLDKAITTIQTVNYLYEKYNINKLYLIIGADNLQSLDKWTDINKLHKKVEFIVATRDNLPIDNKYKLLDVNCDISSTKIRKDLDIIQK
jgi:nicotinate-nucleotide adenylyltransferase